jgi:hypothetical protein
MTERQPDPQTVRDLHARLRVDAALRDSFRPTETLARLAGGLPEDDLVIAAALSALREDCTVARDADGQIWTLRPAVRRKVLTSLPDEQVVSGDTSVARALSGIAGYQPQAIQRLVRYSEKGRSPPAAVLARRLHSLERAGPNAPAHDLVAGLRGALNAAEQTERSEQLLSNGLFGRDEEQAVLLDWIAHPQKDTPIRSLHVSGLPGIGKSYLLQSVVQKARDSETGVLVIWLDFDRSGLSVSDATAFFEEISRQIGDALPSSAGQLHEIRMQAARERTALSPREAGYALPRRLMSAMGKAVAAQASPVLIVLDTVEVLRAHGETAVMRLFELLDSLLKAGVAPLAVLSAGRGDALDPVPNRKAGDVTLGGLTDATASAFLAAQKVPEAARATILALAGGNPLLLKLGARAHADDLSLNAERPGRPDVTGVDLYRAILSRLDPPLNALAEAGLVLHRLRPEHLENILAPALDLSLTAARSKALLRDLATQKWLVEGDPSEGWLRHRHDIRAAFLPMLYRDQPALARRVNEEAAAVLAQSDPVAALYHRLQLTRAGLPLPPIDPLLTTRFSATMIDELPAPARDAVRRARGERSENFRVGADIDTPVESTGTVRPLPSGAFVFDRNRGRLIARADLRPRDIDPRLTDDLRLMLANGDRREAAYLIDKGLAAPFAADDPGAMVILTHLWLSGAWASALRLWRSMGAPVDTDDPMLTRSVREIDAEARFVTARHRLPRLSPPPSSGRIALLGAAYDVALVTQGAMDPTTGEGAMRAAALLAPWLPGMGDGALAHMLAKAEVRRERAGLGLAPDLPEAMRPGCLIAPLIPHLVPMTALATDRAGQRRAEWLAALAPGLDQILRHQAPWIELDPGTIQRAADSPFEMLDLLAGCGLLADAAIAMALALNDPELARLAASAERWRRMSHGLWSLSPRSPRGWRGDPALDAATMHLLTALTDRPAEADRLTRLWLTNDAARIALGRRLRGHMPPGDPIARAHAALRRGLPPGLAAAVAVLPRPDFN